MAESSGQPVSGSYQLRSLAELLATDDSAWPLVKSWIDAATNAVEVLPPSDPARGDALVATQVTLRSPMGAVIYQTGGLLIDHGWLRVLGSGHMRLPRTLAGWNWGKTVQHDGERPAQFLIADDVIGGFFALDGGALGPGKGEVHYFAPDTLAWENLGLGYTGFLQWILSGDLQGYYENMRWPGWRQEITDIKGDQALSIYPFPFSREGKDVARCSREPVGVEEIYSLYVNEFAPKLASLPDGAQFTINWTARKG